MGRRDISQRGDVICGDNEDVDWCLRVDIVEGQHALRFSDDSRWQLPIGDAAEQALRHGLLVFVGRRRCFRFVRGWGVFRAFRRLFRRGFAGFRHPAPLRAEILIVAIIPLLPTQALSAGRARGGARSNTHHGSLMNDPGDPMIRQRKG